MKAPESISHDAVIELLPWLVNGTMESSQREAVQKHAQSCVVCRRELKALRVLRDFVGDDAASEIIPPPDMRNINARIDKLIEQQGRKHPFLSRLQNQFNSPWKLGFAIQTLLVIVLAAALMWPSPPEPEFTTLTSPQQLPVGHHVRVVFSPETTLSELDALLDEMALTVENGPSAQGVYTLAMAPGLDPADREQLLMKLQRQPLVEFAQPAVLSASPNQ